MKKTLIGLVVLVALLSGCSKKTPSSKIVLIETMEHKERLKIEAEASAFFAAKDFTKIEDLVNKYRTSKECYPNGTWKLSSVYSGILPGDDKSDDEWQTNLTILRDWVQVRPDSVTARVALANALLSYGWKARGTGYAGSVTETGWKLFHERLIEAVQVLKQNEALSEKCPYSWTVLLTAAMGLGVEKSVYDSIFQKAIASEPDCSGYYSQMAYYLLPRWHGQPGDTAAFLKKAADQAGGDKGDLLYARVSWFIEGIESNVFEEDSFSWERADRGFQLLEKQFPDSLFVQNERAYIAVMGCDKTLAPRKLVDDLHGQIDPTAWTSKENFIRLTKDLYHH
jgi:hypothetical protein